MRSSKYRPLSNEQKATVIEMYVSGHPVKNIAADVGVAMTTVTNIAKSAGIKLREIGVSRRWSDEKRKEAISLVDSGLSVRQSCEIAGVPNGTLTLWLSKRRKEGKAREKAMTPAPSRHDRELMARQKMIMDLFKPTSMAL